MRSNQFNHKSLDYRTVQRYKSSSFPIILRYFYLLITLFSCDIPLLWYTCRSSVYLQLDHFLGVMIDPTNTCMVIDDDHKEQIGDRRKQVIVYWHSISTFVATLPEMLWKY